MWGGGDTPSSVQAVTQTGPAKAQGAEQIREERAGVRKFRCAAGKEPFHKRAVGVDSVGSVTDGEIQSLPMREK